MPRWEKQFVMDVKQDASPEGRANNTVGVVCGNHASEGGQSGAPVGMLQVVAQSVVLPVALRRTFGLFFLEKRRTELIDGCLQNKNKTKHNKSSQDVQCRVHVDAL